MSAIPFAGSPISRSPDKNRVAQPPSAVFLVLVFLVLGLLLVLILILTNG
jgi:hypothetical protein